MRDALKETASPTWRGSLPHRIAAILALTLTSALLLAPGAYRCTPLPTEPVRDDQCDDGTPLTCRMVEPDCGDDAIAAIQDGCYVCVNPATCRPWGTPGCRTDQECADDHYCDPCGTSSCPACRDCVPACAPTPCESEPAASCLMVRPDCGDNGVAVVRGGCWVCVTLGTCEPARDPSCDDGTVPICPIIPPLCDEWEILAHQHGCFVCVNPATCLPWGTPECERDDDCPRGFVCNDCASSSCPFCDDCVAACTPAMF